ncbi:CSMD1-like protein [Mya arenaria]|uniref:CSMD1-like protein n=1 Tax=Mya arenaria TaxID=6604 RepID=A0ABY7ERH4_MYAAR|nr:CSMD1-like protein [Mya arenaria]
MKPSIDGNYFCDDLGNLGYRGCNFFGPHRHDIPGGGGLYHVHGRDGASRVGHVTTDAHGDMKYDIIHSDYLSSCQNSWVLQTCYRCRGSLQKCVGTGSGSSYSVEDCPSLLDGSAVLSVYYTENECGYSNCIPNTQYSTSESCQQFATCNSDCKNFRLKAIIWQDIKVAADDTQNFETTVIYERECYDSNSAPTCPTLTNTTTRHVTTTGTTLCSVSTYICATGYEITTGTPNRLCRSDSTWSGSEPACSLISCATPTNPSNGMVHLLGPDTSFQQQIQYQCDTGYTLEGTAKQDCLANKSWSGNPPVCNAVDCGTIAAPGNGTVDFPGGTIVNQKANFTCSPGFKLSDISSIICTATGLWNKDPPTCIYNECPALDNTSTRLVQNPAVRIPGSTATYSCVTGYELSAGMNQQTCQPSLAWSGNVPTCSKVNCGSPGTPQNGSFVLLNGATTYESLVQYSCNSGFNLSGSETRECLADGSWSGLLPVCNIVYCNAPIEPQNGSVTTPGGTAFQQQAFYECNDGFVLNGSLISTCNSTALWDATSPICDPIVDCGLLDPPGNGTVNFPGGTTVNQEANFICDPGFKLSDITFVICTESGTWNKDPPTCVYNECPELDNTSYRLVQNPAVRIPGSTATYSCIAGYELSAGINQRTCQGSLAWDGITPICSKVNCSSPETLQNGSVVLLNSTVSYEDLVQYSCIDGFNLSGNETRECLSDGNWSGMLPVCNIVYCNAPIEPQNGSVSTPGGTAFEQQALFDCDEGFVLNGSSFSTCNASALWDAIPPSCDLIDCGPVSAPSQGHVILSNGIGGNTTFGANATFQCYAGYQLTHYQQRTCDDIIDNVNE